MTEMGSPKNDQNRLCNRAIELEESGDLEAAATLYRQGIACDESNATPYLYLGYLLEQLEQHGAAVQVWSLGADLDPHMINAWRSPGIAPDIRRRSRTANDAIRRHFTDLHQASIAAYQEQHPEADIDRIAAAIWCQTHDSDFDYKDPRHKPHVFFVPDLDPIAVYGPQHMPWQGSLEAAADDIRQEFLVAREKLAGEEKPYLKPRAAGLGEAWKPIADSLNWGSFHLYKQGVANEQLLELFPVTLEALSSVPLLATATGPNEVLFSVLRGRQRIPPHFGVANTDITVHMPIITTEQSAIRVANDTYNWRYGEVFGFDDAFDHESWNDSDEARVNLLFEAWHPGLTEHEKGAVAASFDGRECWNQLRHI
jgi:hypothetical protein